MRKISIIGLVAIMLGLLAAACSSPTATPVPPTATTAPTATKAAPTATSAPGPGPTQNVATSTPVPPTPTTAPTNTAAPTPTGVPGVITFGTIDPLTGSGAPWGIAASNGVEMSMNDINNAGGITVAGKRYIFKQIKEDDKYLAAPGVTAANKLIFQDKVKFLVGALASASVAAWTPLAEDNKVINVIDTWMGPAILQGRTYTFRFADGGMMPPVHHSLPHWQYVLAQNPNIKTFVMTTPNDQSGWDTAQADCDAAGSLGIKLLGTEFYERTVTDVRPIVTKLLALKPDIIDVKGSPTGIVANLIKTFRQQGYTGKFVGTGWSAPDLLAAGDSVTDIEGVYGVEPATTGPELPPKIAEFWTKYEAIYHARDPFASACYDMLPTLVQGIKKADSLDTTKVAAALESLAGTYWDGLWGKTTIGGMDVYGRNAQIMSPIPLDEIVNGRNVQRAIVDPNLKLIPPKKWW